MIAGLLTGCSPGVNTPVPDVKLSSKPLATVSSIPKPIESVVPVVVEPIKDGIGKVQQAGEPSNAPSPLPTATPSPEETSNSSGSSSVTPTPSATPKSGTTGSFPAPTFSDVKPVKEGIRTTSMSVFFKDPAKIRYKTEINEFVSLAGANVTNINNLIKKYDITVYIPDSAKGKTEEQLEAQEKREESLSGADIPNKGSIYYIYAYTPINIKEFIEALRLDPSVLSANEEGYGGTG